MSRSAKTTSAIALFIALSLLLCSCGVFVSYELKIPDSVDKDDINDLPDPEKVTPDTVETIDFGFTDTFDPTKMLSLLHKYNFGFDYITIAMDIEDCAMFTHSELYIDSGIYERNSALEDTFSFKFSKINEDADTLLKNIKSASGSSENYADILAISLGEAYKLEEANLLTDLTGLPFISTNQDYFSESADLGLDSVYLLAGSASYLPSQTRVLFFNRSELKKLEKSSPYSLITSKKWTWDALLTYLSEDATLSTEQDLASLIGATVRNGDEIKKAKAKELAESFSALSVTEKAKESFLSGTSLFYLGTFADLTDFMDPENPVGIMPLPIFEEGDSYSNIRLASEVTVFACPKNSSDIERSAFLISAINAASNDYIESVFCRISKNGMLSDNGSQLSLGHIYSADTVIIYPEGHPKAPVTEEEPEDTETEEKEKT
ncbi:MAG: hypothetical protein IJZ03_00960 [Clostridia bacterium]|nr:hypothetical protein [Clostridia bacterium]